MDGCQCNQGSRHLPKLTHHSKTHLCNDREFICATCYSMRSILEQVGLALETPTRVTYLLCNSSGGGMCISQIACICRAQQALQLLVYFPLCKHNHSSSPGVALIEFTWDFLLCSMWRLRWLWKKISFSLHYTTTSSAHPNRRVWFKPRLIEWCFYLLQTVIFQHFRHLWYVQYVDLVHWVIFRLYLWGDIIQGYYIQAHIGYTTLGFVLHELLIGTCLL